MEEGERRIKMPEGRVEESEGTKEREREKKGKGKWRKWRGWESGRVG